MVRTIRQIRAALAKGEAIAPGEREALRAYARQYRGRSQHLSVPPEDVERWKEAAGAAGSSLSAWAREKVDEGLHGTSNAVVNAWRRQNAELRDEREQLQQMQRSLLAQLDEKDQQIRVLNTHLQELVALAQGHSGGV